MSSYSNNAAKKILPTMMIASIIIYNFTPSRSTVLSTYYYAESLSIILFAVFIVIELIVKIKSKTRIIEYTIPNIALSAISKYELIMLKLKDDGNLLYHHAYVLNQRNIYNKSSEINILCRKSTLNNRLNHQLFSYIPINAKEGAKIQKSPNKWKIGNGQEVNNVLIKTKKAK